MEHYTLEAKLGEGCFGTVYAATRKDSGLPVAIKRVRIGSHQLQHGIPMRAFRELMSMRRLSFSDDDKRSSTLRSSALTDASFGRVKVGSSGEDGSENVVALYEVFAWGSSIALVMERCVTDLGSILTTRSYLRPLPLAEAKLWMHMILSGLAFVHRRGLLHRDIKPCNIFASALGTIKLGDFGLARISTQGKEDMTHETATRWYRAPELLFGERRYGPAIDIWSAGCVLGELLFGYGGTALFPGDGDFAQMHLIFSILGTPTPETWQGVEQLPDWGKIILTPAAGIGLASLLPHVSEDALDLLGAMLALDPARRPSAEDCLRHRFFSTPPFAVSHSASMLAKPEELLRSVKVAQQRHKRASAVQLVRGDYIRADALGRAGDPTTIDCCEAPPFLSPAALSAGHAPSASIVDPYSF